MKNAPASLDTGASSRHPRLLHRGLRAAAEVRRVHVHGGGTVRQRDGTEGPGAAAGAALAAMAFWRVTRRGIALGVGKIINIQTNKQNVDRAESPSEFGAQIEAKFEIAQGDTLECFTTRVE